MKRSSGITKRIEVWTVNKGTKTEKSIVKVAVRYNDGKFHSATNFKDKS